MSSDPSIRVPITTEADPAGVDEISAKLDELHEKAAGAAGKPMALAPEMLDPAAIKEVTQEIKEQGAAVAGTAGRYRELEESVREAAEEQARADVERAKAMRSQREQDDQLRQISANTRNMLLVEGIPSMNRSQIIAMQRRIGTVPDGVWGVKSIGRRKPSRMDGRDFENSLALIRTPLP